MSDDRPHIEVLYPAKNGDEVTEKKVTARVRVARSPAGVPLCRVEWNLDGALVGITKILGNPETKVIERTIQISAAKEHELFVWVFNCTGPNRDHAIRNFVYQGEDKKPPSYTIFAPNKVGSLDGQATIEISGTAKDDSGVAAVEWSLDDTTYQPVLTADGWAHWSFEFSVNNYGLYPFFVRFTDKKGNHTAAVRQVEVVKPNIYKDANELISAALYLKDLLRYANSHVLTPGGPLTVEMLEALFYQPFFRLTDRFLEAGRLPINQVRLCIEVLRRYLAATAPGIPPTSSGPVAQWTFEEGSGTTTADVTGNGSTGTLQGPTWAAGQSGGALSFDGVNDYVQVDNPTPLKMTTAVSLCAWIYPQGPGSEGIGGIIVNKEGEYEFARYPNGTIRWAFANTKPGWKWINTGFVAPLNQWTHIAVVYHNGAVTTYANGQPVHSYNGTGPIGSFDPEVNDMRLGGRLQYGPQNFHGLIDDVRIFNYPLSASQVVAQMAPPVPPVPPAQLVAHWMFDEGNGTNTANAAGDSSHGVLEGPAWTTGRFDTGLRFDGGEDHVSFPDTAQLKDVINDFTVAFWARPEVPRMTDEENTSGITGLSGQRYAIEPQHGGVFGSADHAGAGISVGTNGVSVYEHSNDYLPALLVYEKPISGWTHVAVIYRDRQPSLYLNGTLVKTGLASPKSFVHVCPASLGGRNLGPFQGRLDEVRIYDQALSEDVLTTLVAEDIFAVAQAQYCLAAYQSLLGRAGTSYEALRLARGTDHTARTTLANNLGIPLERLDELYVAPDQITEANLEKLFGLVDTVPDPLRDIDPPSFQQWRLDYLRHFWREQDWQFDPYSQLLVPIVDPDVIGPDDLRQPVSGQEAFDLWHQRREWVDDQLQTFKSLTKMMNDQTVPDLAAMFALMYEAIPYAYGEADAQPAAWKDIQPAEFDQLRDDLQSSDAATREQATLSIQENLHLSVESFTRLLTVRDNDALAAIDPRITVSLEEWQAAYDILVQAQKVALIPAWMDEEQMQGVSLDPKPFWISQREPQAGDWPPLIPDGQPLIDPAVFEPEDLPDPTVGKQAAEFLAARQAALVEIIKALKQARETAGFEAMLRLALGHPHPGNPLQYDLDALQSDLEKIDDPEKVTEATQHITNDLYLTIEGFKLLMSLRARDAEADPLKKPTIAEYTQLYALLTPPRKIKHEFPNWIAEEQQANLVYWNTFKARLPRWRASAEDRAQWQQALRARSTAPVIDPDLIGREDLKNPVDGNVAFDLWKQRAVWLEATFNSLRGAQEQQATLIDGFDTIVAETLGVPIATVLDLVQQSLEGEDVKPALQQLDLPGEAFRYLRLIRALVTSADQVVTEVEWTHVYNILVQVKKRREFAVWRDAEEASPLEFTAEYFQLSDHEPELVPWRSNPEARRAWQATLRSRLDQEQTVEEGLRAAVASAEERTLPLLRAALINRIAAYQNKTEAEAQESLSVQLAIDVRNTASQLTTRVLQAIETVQGVLFSLRTGRFVSGHPADSWELAYLDKGNKVLFKDDHFDAEWKWMGTHATWASAVIGYYYLEILLLPSLRQAQSPAAPHLDPTTPFQKLLADLNDSAQLTPQQVRTLAAAYFTAIKATLPASLKTYALTDLVSQEELAKRGEVIRTVYIALKLGTPPNPHLSASNLQELLYFVPLHLAQQLQQLGEYVAALDWYQTIYAYNLFNRTTTPFDERKIYYGLELERNDPPGILEPREPHWLLQGLDVHAMAVSRPNPQTRYLLLALARCFMEFGDEEFTRDTFESVGRARALYEIARQLMLLPELQPPPPSLDSDLIPPNPVQELQRMRIELQLEKIRQGRNIAGLKRQLDLDTAPDALSAFPVVAGGQLVAAGNTGLRPTPYRYKVLIERAKQLIQHAAQIEAGLLASLEKADAESYNLLKARQDLRLAHGSVQVQRQRVNEANEGVALAQLQKQRAEIQVTGYDGLINAGFHGLEEQALGLMAEAASLQYKAEGLHYAAATLPASVSYSVSVTAGPNPSVTNTYSIGYSPSGQVSSIASGLASQAGAKSTQAQSLLAQAGIERAKMEWELQKQIAEQDVVIGDQQVRVAQAHVGVAQAELKVAQMQVENAEAVINFLGTKFTNVELYNWMSGVLGGVYRYFLQQAAAIAMLAQYQLAFERQQSVPNFILADYWKPPSSGKSNPNRRGLTGSARLLEDIYQLDQYAFKTDQRKLDLAQTFSLARLDPLAFQQFRESGALRFATPMRRFDEGFPGHYLRLVKRVRVSVIALIPAVDGIRATLRAATGFSRVVIGGDFFKEAIIRRDPDVIAFTAPSGGTGVFEMDAQPELLLPFEGMGVDALWEFEMPRAANLIDFSTIADVLFTVEYTALHSFDYRDQVIKRLDPTISADMPFSFRSELADQWYDLHNPDQSATPMAVRFSTGRQDFPPNLDYLRIEHVTLYFARATGATFEVEVKHLRFTPNGSGQTIGGGGTTTDGVLGTRRGNAGSWLPMIGKPPFGEWELALPNTEEIKDLFKDGAIEDILLVITFGGDRPAWPGS